MSEAAHVAAFEAERAHLFGVAYRMLGSAAEAEDVVQDAFLRWSREDVRDVVSPRALLTTIVVRLCLDASKSARARRETYVGPWLPEPLVARDASLSLPASPSPDARTELADALSVAFLVLLERLSPLERAAFLLHEVFEVPYDEVARTLATSEAACRQLVARARAHVEENKPRFVAPEEKKRELLMAFLAACAAGDAGALGKVLADDVVARSDGGGRVIAALRPVLGRDRVTRFLFGVMKKFPLMGPPELVRINGEPGLLLVTERGVHTALTLTIVGDRVTDVWLVLNPEKLARVATGP